MVPAGHIPVVEEEVEEQRVADHLSLGQESVADRQEAQVCPLQVVAEVVVLLLPVDGEQVWEEELVDLLLAAEEEVVDCNLSLVQVAVVWEQEEEAVVGCSL